MLLFTSTLSIRKRCKREFPMAAQMEPRKRDIFAFFKPKAFTANAKQSKTPPMKNNVSEIFSVKTKSFRKASQTDDNLAALPALSQKSVEFLPNSRDLSPRISKIFPELDSPSPKIKDLQTGVEKSYNDLVLTSQSCEALPRSLTKKKLCQDIALISPDLTKLSPEVNTLSPKRGNMPFDGSEVCLKKKRNVMPEVFIFPPEICPPSPEIEEVNEEEEFWPMVLSPSHESEAIFTQTTRLSPKGHESSPKKDKSGPKSPTLSAIPEELFSKLTTSSPIGDKLSFMPSESYFSRQSGTPDIPMNPPVLLQDVPKTPEKVKARRYQSNPLQRKAKEPLRPRFVSEPSGNKYTQLMEKQGAKLTNAAYELTEEQSRLLYEDMFKPLDVFALIQSAAKK